MAREAYGSALPLYQCAIDWPAFFQDFPAPDVFEQTVYRWPRQRLRQLQERRFLQVMQAGWNNPFYKTRWTAAGVQPGDVKSLADIVRLPSYTSDDVKQSQLDAPPFGDFHGLNQHDLAHTPFKLQTSGGTTGQPRAMLSDPIAWEVQALAGARSLYIQGARPGDVMQIPATCSLANGPWLQYKACHDFLGVLPLTTGSGVVMSSRTQIETAMRFGTNLWNAFPEYLLRLAQAARDELGIDVRSLGTKFIRSYLGPDLQGLLRRELQETWGCPVYDIYGSNEIGLGAFECTHQRGLHIMEDCVFLEVVDVETGEPLLMGQKGNLVATVLFRTRPPIIRYNMRDLGRILDDQPCACGGHFARMDHFLGRSDAMVKLRGVNVYPMACLSAVKAEAATTGEWVCIVERVNAGGVPRDEMQVQVEVRGDIAHDPEALKLRLARRLKEDLGVVVTVVLVGAGGLAELANTGGREGKARRLIDRRPDYIDTSNN